MKHPSIGRILVWLGFLSLVGCSSAQAPMCQTDQDCGAGQLCVQRRCAALLPETRPEVRPPPVEPNKDGIRDNGQSCDPRAQAWHHDRCKPGFHCAQLGQLAPSTNSVSSSLELDGA